MDKGKIFIGLNNIAGVAVSLQEGFMALGYDADFFSAEKQRHKYNYIEKNSTHLVPKVKQNSIFSKLNYLVFFFKLLFKYKYFIFLQSDWTLFTDYKDIKIFRFFGKKCAVILTGCDARVPKLIEQFKWNPCTYCSEEYKKFVNCNIPKKEKTIPKLPDIFNVVFSPEECSGLLGSKYQVIFYPRNLNTFNTYYPAKDKKKIKILHAPSNTDYKGTKYIREVVKTLKTEFSNFEYVEVSGLSINELYKVIQESDLIIDQLLVGFYGLFAVESMAMGKPVVVYIRPDIWKSMRDTPIYNASPDALYDVLKNILLNPEQLFERGKQSRLYVEQKHDATLVANEIIDKLS